MELVLKLQIILALLIECVVGLGTITQDKAKRTIPGAFLFFDSSDAATTWFGTPTFTAGPTVTDDVGPLVEQLRDSALAMISDSPGEHEVIATTIVTNNNVETAAACVVDTDSYEPFSDTDMGVWNDFLLFAEDSYANELDYVGEAQYLLLYDSGDDSTTTQGYIDFQVATSTVT